MKRIALTSMLTICVAAPAFATPSHTSSTFPNDGYMQEDYTYTNQATYTNMGVYSDSVNANANYGDCPANSWCDSSGQHACSTAGDGSYTSSAAGATANTDCYKACTVATANIAHATEVYGNDYYGAGTDTCGAMACDDGYHIQPTGPGDIIGRDAGTDYVFIDNSGTGSGGSNPSTYGISDNNSFAVDYGDRGVITGHGRCSTQSGTDKNYSSSPADITTTNNLTDETGQMGARYCWCQVDNYIPVVGSSQSLSGPWVYDYDWRDVSNCASACASHCAYDLYNSAVRNWEFSYFIFRSASMGWTLTCGGNIITIIWSGANPADIYANEAGTVTYGGDIRTPRAAAIIPGKVFTGWTFSAPKPEEGIK